MAATDQSGSRASLDAHDRWARDRAARSLTCLPFRRAFYEQLSQGAISSGELAARADWPTLLFAPFGIERAEAHFIWLIRLGVLRREVDGQGLTERVRLTPLGRAVISRWPGEIPRAGLRQRIRENLLRHRPRL
ncbi:MAG: Npun_F0494 family protein [Synechococcaceae cyanobacterium ELA263]